MIYMDVDTALAEVPVNIAPLTDDTDFKSIESAVAYNAAGMTLYWNFVTSAGAYTSTAVTPTSGGSYDWAHQNGGMYTIEIPASGGASINNDTEGYGYFTGVATGVLPWRGPTIGFRAAAINDALCDGGDYLQVDLLQINSVTNAATRLGLSANQIIPATAITGTLSSSQFTTDLTEATDNHYNGRVVIWTSGVLAGQAALITGYTGSNKLVTVSGMTEAPSNTDAFVIV
jgi:hypothetical protein